VITVPGGRLVMTGRVGKVSALLQALGAGDIQPVLGAIDENVVWRLSSLGLQAQGRAAVAEQLQQAAGQVSISRLVQVVEHGPFVVALYDVESRLGGTVYQGPGLTVLRYEDDKIVEASWYRADQFSR
jgi:ketosteroid isomerase-like protein